MSLLELIINPALAHATEEVSKQSFIASFAPILLIMVVFYFLLIRPQNKKMKEHQQMISSISKGDKVLTSGGIYGTVVRIELENNIAFIEVCENVRIKIKYDSISEMVSGDTKVLNENIAKTNNKKKQIVSS